MDALECISTRRSIRKFLNVPVDFETIMTIVEAGSRAPSSGNVQDWKFIIVDKPELKKKLCEHSMGQECVHNSAFLIVICSDPEQTEMHYGLRGSRLYTVQNCAAAAENMLLAAHALGLGGNWVGAFDEEKLRELLDIPKSARPQAILTFGYPDELPDHKRLKDLRVTTFFNSYGVNVRNVHRLLNDYSVDWESRIEQAHSTLERFRKSSKKAGSKMNEQGKSLFKKYAERLKSRKKQ